MTLRERFEETANIGEILTCCCIRYCEKEKSYIGGDLYVLQYIKGAWFMFQELNK